MYGVGSGVGVRGEWGGVWGGSVRGMGGSRGGLAAWIVQRSLESATSGPQTSKRAQPVASADVPLNPKPETLTLNPKP